MPGEIGGDNRRMEPAPAQCTKRACRGMSCDDIFDKGLCNCQKCGKIKNNQCQEKLVATTAEWNQRQRNVQSVHAEGCRVMTSLTKACAIVRSVGRSKTINARRNWWRQPQNGTSASAMYKAC